MSQKLELEFKGLATAAGQLGAPPGSLTVAKNVNFPVPGLVEKRVGLETRAYKFGGCAWKFISTKQLGGNLLMNIGNGTAGSSLQYGTGASGPTAISTPDGTSFSNTATDRMRAAVSLKTHFLTSSRAPARVESDLTMSWAGMPRAPGAYSASLAATATTWLAVGSAVAYRVVWGTVDADGVERVSAPSGRRVVANIATTTGYTGAARSVFLNVTIPKKADTTGTAITTAWFVRVYRSFASVVATGEPNDELQLCYQVNVSAGEIASGAVGVTDTCPESTLGGFLYTNTVSGGDLGSSVIARLPPGTPGLVSGNDRPPLAKEVAAFADSLWWGNFTTLQRLQVSLLAVGAAGLAVGDVVTVAGINFTGVAGAPANTLQFTVELGLASTSLNVRATANNLVAAVNAEPTQVLVTAAYVGSDASPGTIGAMLFEARRSDAAAFTFTTSGAVTPFLPQASLTSKQDTWNNGVAISKPFQGDAVPPANYLRVGRNDTTIQAMVPLRDALFIFTDDGIYWARGNSPADFVIESFDTTFRLLNRESASACGDAIYAWGYEGIAKITNGGVEYIDIPIRNYVAAAVSNFQPVKSWPITSFQARAFSTAYRIARRVLFFYPRSSYSYACSEALVYNIVTGAWSVYTYNGSGDEAFCAKNCAAVRVSDELLHAGEWSSGSDTYMYADRADMSSTDYVDSDSAANYQSVTSTLTWDSSTPNPGGLCHWQETQLFWSYVDGVSGANQDLPSAATLGITTEAGTSQSASITSITTPQTRVPMEPEVGLATRQTVTLTHTATEYFGLSGFLLLYQPVSSFTTR
jgi:hypothetical protein